MRHYPLYFDLRDEKVIVIGTGETAKAKLRLLMKTEAAIHVFGINPNQKIVEWANDGKLTHHAHMPAKADLKARLVYCALDDEERDLNFAEIAKAQGALVNVVDNLEASHFITPAIVDRDPVTIAIGTEGAAPVLARKIKRLIDDQIPLYTGTLARHGKDFRPQATALPYGSARRSFWADYYDKAGPETLVKKGEEALRPLLKELLQKHLNQSKVTSNGSLSIIGAGPNNPDLLTVKAARVLHEADVVIHGADISANIMELARREALLIDATESTDDDIISHINKGHKIAWLIYGSGKSMQPKLRNFQKLGASVELILGIEASSQPRFTLFSNPLTNSLTNPLQGAA